MCCPRLDARRSAAVLCVLLIGTPVLALAEEPNSPRPLVFTTDDPRLEWGPCPEFLPAECRVAVLQGNPAAQNADVFFKLPPDSAIPHHWHTSAERMILVSGELHLTYDGHEKAVLRPGAYAYGPAKLPHQGFCAAGDPCVLFIAFEQPVDAVPTKAAPGQ